MTGPLGLLRRVPGRIKDELAAMWLLPADPRALAIPRLIVLFFAWTGLTRPTYGVEGFPEIRSLAWRPVGIFELLGVPLIGEPAHSVIMTAFTVVAFLAWIGFKYPVTIKLTALLGLYVYGAPKNFIGVGHQHIPITLTLFVFAFARAADAFSVDAWLKQRKGLPKALPSAEYRWPARFIGIVTLIIYGAAGIAKLRRTGFEWALGGQFEYLLLRHHFTHVPPTDLGVWLAARPALFKTTAFASMLLELSCPLGFVSRWAYRLILPALALMQLVIGLTLTFSFNGVIPVYLALLPWHEIVLWFDRIRAGDVRPATA